MSDYKLTVLYIDDNSDNGYMLAHRFKRYGVKCITSTDGYETIDLIIEHQPDVVMLDLAMPRISGFEVLELIRDHDSLSNMPVWAFTANSIGDARQKCMQAGFDGFIAKPIMRHDIKYFVSQFVTY